MKPHSETARHIAEAKHVAKSVPISEFQRAIYDIMVAKHGIDTVGPYDLYARKGRGHWTLERCRESAAKFTTRAAWQKSEPVAYVKAYREGWLDECCRHMVAGTRGRTVLWPTERCKAEAAKFLTRSAWLKGSPKSYGAAQRRGILAVCCAHMEAPAQRPGGYWTLERCKESAAKHQTRGAWQKDRGGAYHRAIEMGWFEECTSHMAPPRRRTST